MAGRMTNFGFGTLAKPTGKPAEVPTPKVYDFTGGKRPVIPEEERSDLDRRDGPGGASPVPQPRVIDGNRRR